MYCKLFNRKYFSFDSRKIDASKPLILKSFTIWNPNMLLSLSPIKATYIEKNNYMTVQKPGTLLFELVPIKKQNEQDYLEWDKKKSFGLGVKQIGNIISHKYRPLNEESTFDIQTQYKTSLKQLRQLQIKKKANEITLTIASDFEDVKDINPYSIKMSLSEYCTILELASFALPFMLGWQALYTPSFLENDIQE